MRNLLPVTVKRMNIHSQVEMCMTEEAAKQRLVDADTYQRIMPSLCSLDSYCTADPPYRLIASFSNAIVVASVDAGPLASTQTEFLPMIALAMCPP